MGVRFRLAYLYLTFARNKGQCEGRAHFYCYISNNRCISPFTCQRIFCLLLFLACNCKSTRRRQMLVKSSMYLTFIIKIKLPEFQPVFNYSTTNDRYERRFWQAFVCGQGTPCCQTSENVLIERVTISRRVTFGMRLQVDKRIKSIEQQ